MGYPIATMLAEKLATAILLGAADTRVPDDADIYTVTRRHHDLTTARSSCAGCNRPVPRGRDRAAAIRGRARQLRARTYTAYRTALGVDGAALPADFGEVDTVITFADPAGRPDSRPALAGTR